MPINNPYAEALHRCLETAIRLNLDVELLKSYLQRGELQHDLVQNSAGKPIPLNKTVLDAVQTIVGNLGSNKYLYSILITALTEKLVNPNQDIRIAQTSLPNGYSNRNTDQVFVTPFLRRAKGVQPCRGMNAATWIAALSASR